MLANGSHGVNTCDCDQNQVGLIERSQVLGIGNLRGTQDRVRARPINTTLSKNRRFFTLQFMPDELPDPSQHSQQAFQWLGGVGCVVVACGCKGFQHKFISCVLRLYYLHVSEGPLDGPDLCACRHGTARLSLRNATDKASRHS